ncbi:MAG: hypothetical protein A3H79_00860 [Candidatus Levybacteria bacterium RIFCSPLOWO2_02_FULL_36_8b]|nr:MAG: hypothetical protein A3H79_00860 [Candidatus Levybacteria bacterium RIFCSPLOWO2_02_FULL_36_8b]
MTKKLLRQLINLSYEKMTLNQEKVELISKYLNRKELKEYLKALKKWENETSVIISLPKMPEIEEQKMFLNLFPNKKIVYNIDPGLLVGVEIKNNDLIYNLNLKNTLENLLKHINKQ